MMESITHADLANEISMTRSAFGGTFLVVEGVTDSRLYAKFADPENVRILIAHSKDNVRRSVEESCGRRGDRAVVGIVDKDMDGLIGKRRDPPVFETDLNDMESSILRSPAFGDILAEYGDRERVERFVERNGDIPSRLAESAAPIGYLMYLSYRKGMNLSFKGLDFERFIDRDTLANDVPRMVSDVYARSMGQMHPKSAVTDQVRSMMRKGADPWEAVRGHDAVRILAIGLRYAFGSYNSRRMMDGELGGALRLAYSMEYFRATRLYASTDAWCSENGLTLWISHRSP